MRLVLIYDKSIKGNLQSLKLLTKAAQDKGLTVIPLEISDPPIQLKKTDLLYRISTKPQARQLEKYLARFSPTTFYHNRHSALAKSVDIATVNLIHLSSGLPVIPSIYYLLPQKKYLKEAVEQLGGFPVVLKSGGLSHGQGVIKVESLDSLVSLVDFLASIDLLSSFILCRFIHHQAQARLIVVGDQVIASYQNLVSGDFRTNREVTGITRQRLVFQPSSEMKKVAVQATQVLGFEAGGVDLLLEKKTNQFYISEVNLPFYFPVAQRLTKVDIAGQMVDYLIDKSKKSLSK